MPRLPLGSGIQVEQLGLLAIRVHVVGVNRCEALVNAFGKPT
jgi:hypothetical protein